MNASSSSGPVSAPRSKFKRFLQNLALALITFLFCGLILEVALRIAGYGNLEIYEPDAKLYWRLKPN